MRYLNYTESYVLRVLSCKPDILLDPMKISNNELEILIKSFKESQDILLEEGYISIRPLPTKALFGVVSITSSNGFTGTFDLSLERKLTFRGLWYYFAFLKQIDDICAP